MSGINDACHLIIFPSVPKAPVCAAMVCRCRIEARLLSRKVGLMLSDDLSILLHICNATIRLRRLKTCLAVLACLCVKFLHLLRTQFPSRVKRMWGSSSNEDIRLLASTDDPVWHHLDAH
jgi:hypothetical protein